MAALVLAAAFGSAPAPATSQPGTERGGGGAAETFTLVTGDRVTIPAAGALWIDPGEGRDHITFSVSEAGDRLDVIPSDAVALLKAGKLDRRLFDVAGLQRMGYGDADRAELPLIVQDGGRAAKVRGAGARTKALPAVEATGVRQPKAQAGDFWEDITRGEALESGITKVWLDGLAQPSLDVSVPHIGAPTAWAAGFTGEGVKVAVVDTGIDETHPDLAGRVADSRNFTDEPDADLVGHGTHVASSVAGSKGVAPGAQLLDAKVCVEFGCEESAIIAGMQWAAESGASVVNLSLGRADGPEVDPLEAAVATLSAEHDTLFVVAAGNYGRFALSSPSTADAALSVGAVDDADQLAEFSSAGPRVGDAAIKPDISAPGVAINAAKAGGGYVEMEGTSMASPHVAGAAALVRQQHPGWTGPQTKAHLMGAAQPDDDVFGAGAGRVDVARAVSQEVHAEPASVSFGTQIWPHDDDEVLTRTVTYSNPGREPLTLDLALAGAQTGVFALGADQVTIPAGGTAAVDVRADTRITSPDGPLTARVVASDGTTTVTTPLAVVREVESYELTVRNLGLDGLPTEDASTLVFGLDNRFLEDFVDSTVRVPKGRYHLQSNVYTGDDTAVLLQPLVDVSADTTVELDARQARPFTVGFEHDDVEWAAGLLSYMRIAPYTLRYTFYLGDRGLATMSAAQFGPEVGQDELRSLLQGSWAGSGGERVYNLAFFEQGRMLAGLDRQVRDADLARVQADYRAAGADRQGVQYPYASLPGVDDLDYPAISEGFAFPLPQRRTELFNIDDGVLWATEFDQLDANGEPESGQFTVPRSLRPGRMVRAQWNGSVLGPSVSIGWTEDEHCPNLAERAADTILVVIPALTDAGGHAGCGGWESSITRLIRDGELIGEQPYPAGGFFDVPADAGTYRLETDIDRTATAALSTRITAAWTFSSQPDVEQLPLMAVRFAPELDRHNQAPAGRTLTVPVSVDKAGPVGRIGKPTVEASFDDGATWKPVTVRRQGDGYAAELKHPRGAQHVSLRAKASDNRGNAVEQTILRAYLLK